MKRSQDGVGSRQDQTYRHCQHSLHTKSRSSSKESFGIKIFLRNSISIDFLPHSLLLLCFPSHRCDLPLSPLGLASDVHEDVEQDKTEGDEEAEEEPDVDMFDVGSCWQTVGH